MTGSMVRFVVNPKVIDGWTDALKLVRANRYEEDALRTFIESARYLLRRRDQLDVVRAAMPPDKETSFRRPTTRQQQQLFDATADFFNAAYSTLSAEAGIVRRFAGVYPNAPVGTNKALIEWIWSDVCGRRESHAGFVAEAERARRFRALVAHPQDAPPYNWGTACYPGYELVHVILYGDLGRGRNPVPLGARNDHILAPVLGGWQFAAPDEVSVTNSILSLGMELMIPILEARSATAFTRARSRSEIEALLMPREVDVFLRSRAVSSRFDIDDDTPPLVQV